MPRSLLLLALLLVVAPGAVRGQELPGSARQVGLSGATHAFSNGTAALHANPAGMSLLHQYMIEANYQYWRGPDDHQTSISVVDSATNQSFALGAAYTYHHGLFGSASGQDASFHGVKAGLSTGFSAGNLGLYLGGEYSYLGAAVEKAHDATFGAIVSISQMVNVGVVGHNLFSPHPGLNPRALTTGISVGQESFAVGFDATFDFDTRDELAMIYAVGAEYFVAGAAGIRAGYRYDAANGERHSISAGLGYIYRMVGFELAFEQNPKDGKDNRFVGSVVVFIP
jgi:hypothetical protein